jgi:hypothetical protein
MTTEDKKKIQDYLAGVKRHIGDRPRAEQFELMQQLEQHIHERINESPDANVADVIAEMDSPESFGEPGESGTWAPAVLGRMTLGQLSLLILIVGVLTPFLLMALSQLIRGNVGSMINVALPIGVVLVIIALATGIAARREPTGKVTIIASSAILALLTVFVPVNRGISSRPEPTESLHRIESDDPAGE